MTTGLAYKAAIYAPRSVDATEATVLVPAAGAPHSDKALVATIQGYSDALGTYKGYLQPPKGRRGKLDFLTKNADTGELALDLMDVRTGASNVVRWFSSFLGDVQGREALKGCLVRVWESTDAGATWTAYFTGRITKVQRDARLTYRLTVRDLATDLARPLFVGVPSLSVASYATKQALIPFALADAWGPLAGVGRLNGTMTTGSGAVPLYLKLTDEARLSQYALVTDQLWSYLDISIAEAVTDALTGGAASFTYTIQPKALNVTDTRLVAQVKRLDTNASGTLCVRTLTATRNKDGHYKPTAVELVQPTGGAFAVPPAGTACTIVITADMAPSAGDCILISDVHPVQLLADILDGYYGRLTATGTPARSVARDATSFAALLADLTFPTVRFLIEQPEAKALDWIKANILQPCQIGLVLTPDGKAKVLDLRRVVVPGAIQTIVDADLVADASADAWSTAQDDAVTWTQVTIYRDRLADWHLVQADGSRYPAAPSALIETTDHPVIYLPATSTRATDLAENPLAIDAKGFRAVAGATKQARAEQERWIRVAEQVARDIEGPFADGAQHVSLTTRRTANTTPVGEGDLVYVTLSSLPNLTTNQLGGTILCRVMEKQHDGATFKFDLLWLGAATTSAAPTFGTPAQDATVPRHRVTLPVTLNAAAEPVQVQVAVTATSVGTIPAASSALWTYAATTTTSATLTLLNLPGGSRVWLRARTQTLDKAGLKLPSAWVSPATDHVDTATITAPSALALSGSASAHTATVTWTVGDAKCSTEILVTSGAVAPSWSSADVVDVVSPGTTRYTLAGLDGPSLAHVVAVRHRDPYGGTSAVVTLSLTTGASTTAAPAPKGLTVLVL